MSDNDALFESEEEKESIITPYLSKTYVNNTETIAQDLHEETIPFDDTKISLKGSKFKVNLRKNILLSDDEDEEFQEPSKELTNTKKKYRYKEQVHTASG